MDVDIQVCEPDSTVEINDSDAQPRPQTQLEAHRERYREQQRFCAETLSNAFSERGRARQELAEAKRRREVKMNALQAVQRTYDEGFRAAEAASTELHLLKSRFKELQENLQSETNWQPSVVMTNKEVQALTAKVEKLRSEKRPRRLDGSGSGPPTANS